MGRPALIAGGAVVGIAAFGWDGPRSFDADELAWLTRLAAHTAIAVDRSQLLATARSTAETLQRALLPTIPLPVAGWELGTRYLPAVEGTQVAATGTTRSRSVTAGSAWCWATSWARVCRPRP